MTRLLHAVDDVLARGIIIEQHRHVLLRKLKFVLENLGHEFGVIDTAIELVTASSLEYLLIPTIKARLLGVVFAAVIAPPSRGP